MRANRPRALVQMATGSGKTYTAVALIYRLIKYAGARRVLFLVDRSNLARQTLREFQQDTTPDDGRKFAELFTSSTFPVEYHRPGQPGSASRTIQRLYSILKGEPEFDPAAEEEELTRPRALQREPLPIVYNPARVPIEIFDFVVTDECHRSIYHLWRQVLEYFDASLVGLTATPSSRPSVSSTRTWSWRTTTSQAVADGVNVDFDVYRIRTEITPAGSNLDAGFYVTG